MLSVFIRVSEYAPYELDEAWYYKENMKGSLPFSFLSTDSTNNLIQGNTYTVVPQKTPSDPIISLPF